jgi:DNA (cytosine-5)-methyltransferase 1
VSGRLAVGSLFSGVGGFERGFEQAGFEVAWQVEIDKDAVSVLERHWPDVPRYGDVATVDPTILAPVDVVIFGSPCQDFSVAGKRAGMAGERSGLFGEAIRIIRGLRPTPAFCVWENVPGALSSAGGRDFGAVLDELANIGALDIAWRVLDARHFGVPQRRRRIFLVADFGAVRAGQILFESPSGSRDSAPSGAARERAAGDAAGGAGVVGIFGGNRTSGAIDVATACNAHGGPHGRLDFESETFVVDNSVTASAGHPDSNAPGRHREDDENLVPVAYGFGTSALDTPQANTAPPLMAKMNGQRTGSDPTAYVAFHLTQDPINGAESPALGAGNEAGCATVAVATWDERNVTSRAIRTRVDYGAPANTLHAEGLSVITPMAVRRLTPTECERLMNWPDDWTRYRADGSELSDGTRYRLIGNGVVSSVAYWIAVRMRAALEAAP